MLQIGLDLSLTIVKWTKFINNATLKWLQTSPKYISKNTKSHQKSPNQPEAPVRSSQFYEFILEIELPDTSDCCSDQVYLEITTVGTTWCEAFLMMNCQAWLFLFWTLGDVLYTDQRLTKNFITAQSSQFWHEKPPNRQYTTKKYWMISKFDYIERKKYSFVTYFWFLWKVVPFNVWQVWPNITCQTDRKMKSGVFVRCVSKEELA